MHIFIYCKYTCRVLIREAFAKLDTDAIYAYIHTYIHTYRALMGRHSRRLIQTLYMHTYIHTYIQGNDGEALAKIDTDALYAYIHTYIHTGH